MIITCHEHIILFLNHVLTFFCRYATNNFKQDNYDQYLKSDRLENLYDNKLNMYVAVEPPADTHKSFQHEVI